MSQFAYNEEDTRPIVERPDGYWENIFEKYNNQSNLLKCVEGTLNKDPKIYEWILEQWAYTAEYNKSKKVGMNTASEWVPSRRKDKFAEETPGPVYAVTVIPHDTAQMILNEWIEFSGLPPTFPDGTAIPPVKTYFELMAAMTKFNPYWILEVCAFAFSYQDMTRTNPSEDYNYNATPQQIIQITDNLEKLKTKLELQQTIEASIPAWIVKLEQSPNIRSPLTLTEVTEMCQLTLPGINYEDKVLKYIRIILIGCSIIRDSHHNQTIEFENSIYLAGIPKNNEHDADKNLQVEVLGLILGALKYRLGDQTTVTFADLAWAIKDNIYYPKFIDYLNLLK